MHVRRGDVCASAADDYLKLLFLITIPSFLLMESTNIADARLPQSPPLLGIKLRLIHRHSIFSHHQNLTLLIDGDIRGGLMPDSRGSLFLLNVSVGHPPLPQLLAMDSGSTNVWFQCLPCNPHCFHQMSPIFHPSSSSAYHPLFCPPNAHAPRLCTYSLQYGDNTTSSGSLALEDLTFATSDQGTTTIPQVLVGCGHNNAGSLESLASGIIGLGLAPDPSSLLRRIGKLGGSMRFSYCIGNLNDPDYQYNHLILGNSAIIQGLSTPIQVFNGWYYLSLQGISVGEEILPIKPDIFKRNPSSGSGGVIIDSGTTFVYLNELGLKPLKAKVQSLIGGFLDETTIHEHPDWLCYKGNWVMEELRGFLAVTLHFAGGADLVLEADAMFLKVRLGVYCMSVVPNVPQLRGLSIIGIRAQQYHNVAYDLDTMKLYLQRVDCQLLED